MLPNQTQLLPEDVECAELASALRASIGLLGDSAPQTVDARFREALSDVIQGIQRRGRFDLLRRFVAHGSLVPSWVSRHENRPRALNDDELASFVDFVTGHMVTKFQGRLGELLATPALSKLAAQMRENGTASEDAVLVPGSAIRCRALRDQRPVVTSGDAEVGIPGPDAIVASVDARSRLVVHATVEIKSMYVSPSKIAAQFRSHRSALARGAKIWDQWFDANSVQMGGSGGREASSVARVFVQPARWLLTRGFCFEPTTDGSRWLVMDRQELPVTGDTCVEDQARGWHVVTLAWSYDALRAAAFALVRGYMAEVGEALSQDPDPDVPLRT